MKRKILKIMLYIAGFFCIVYPIYSKFLSYKNQTQSIYDYKKELATMQEEELKEKLEKSEEFNKINSTETTVVDNSLGNTENPINAYNFLKLGEMMGYITIPKINVEIPIYEGINVNNLTKGVAHMENTSLPNGAKNTHSVLAGHTGISQAEIFDNIDKLEVGDEFYITFYGTTSKYKVIHTKIVFPDETNEIRVEEGKCLVTLVTCTPKSVNTHRLLVKAQKEFEIITPDEKDELLYGKQTEDDTTIDEEITKNDLQLFIEFAGKNLHLFAIIIVLFFIIIVLNILGYIKNKIKKKRKEAKSKYEENR